MSDFMDRHQGIRNMLGIILIFLLVYMVCSQFHLFGVGVYTFQIDDESKSLIIYYESDPYVEIKKDSIQSLELTDDFDKGEAIDLLGEDTYTAGIFKNSTLGEYKLYIKNDVNRVLIIKAAGEYYAINYTNDESTSEVYDALLRWTKET